MQYERIFTSHPHPSDISGDYTLVLPFVQINMNFGFTKIGQFERGTNKWCIVSFVTIIGSSSVNWHVWVQVPFP